MRNRKIKIGILLMVLLTFSACKEVEVTTTVNIDGSLDRLIEIKSDEELDDFSDLPFPVDSTWNYSEEYDSTKEKKYIYQFHKHYANSDQINEEYKIKKNSMSRFNRKLTMKKKFRFFFTYFEYSEQYKKLVEGEYNSFEDYLTADEQMVRTYTANDSNVLQMNMDTAEITQLKKSVEKKFNDWFEKSLLDEILLNIKLDMQKYQVPLNDGNNPEQYRDTIFAYIDSVDIDSMQFKLYNFLNHITETKAFEELISAEETHLDMLEKDLIYAFDLMSFTYNVNMPGVLLDTNADMIKGNHMSWDVDPTELFLVDKSCYAESRIVNTWTFILSGIFILFTIFILIRVAVRNGRK